MEKLKRTIMHIRIMLAGETPQKVMTEEQHLEYKHLCGLTGAELDNIKGPHPCDWCGQKEKCLRDHAILGADW